MTDAAANESPPAPESEAPRARWSLWAIASLVTSVVFGAAAAIAPPCCMFTSPIGIILGVAALVEIGRNPMRRGRGLAVTGIVLALLATVFAVGYAVKLRETIRVRILDGPVEALRAGERDDLDGFRREFVGPGTTASDDEVRAFVDALGDRYGRLRAIDQEKDPDAPPLAPSEIDQADIRVTYLLRFQGGAVRADTSFVAFRAPPGGGLQKMVGRWAWIVVRDPERGDLVYPPGTPTTDEGGSNGSADGESSDESG